MLQAFPLRKSAWSCRVLETSFLILQRSVKYEEVHLWNYETYEDVIERLPFFLEEVYNQKRLHSSIGYVPPAEFEAAVLNMKSADRPVLNL